MPATKTYILSNYNEQKHSWQSDILGIEMNMLTFGTEGFPIVLFPTSMGMSNENKDFKLLEAIGWFIEQGIVKVYCPDSIDKHSWYNDDATPEQKVKNHILYDRMLAEELYPRMKEETGFDRIGAAGCSFGGYHAMNFGLRHPDLTAAIFSMAAKFDIKGQLDGFYNDDVYYNNPPDYIAELNDPWLWKMQIFLGSAEFDMCLDANYSMANQLGLKHVQHTLDVTVGEKHDWPCWRKQFPYYLSLLDIEKTKEKI
ncbi:MAG: esterase [Chitinophagales bacterium]|nr:esterase [Chitinophagales bacterium]MBP9548931.1 esterase [Chitinophagales bacterium]